MAGRTTALSLDARRRGGGLEVDSFYHLGDTPMEGKLCTGLGCFAARGLNLQRWNLAVGQQPRVYCLGRCFSAPSCSDDPEEPLIEVRCRRPIILEGMADGSIRSLAGYGGYRALAMAREMGAKGVLDEIDRSQLRGRGGAGFPAGRKWRSVFEQPDPVKYVVANADEGDHGSYIDKTVIEYAPHRLLEAMAIAALAVGAAKGIVYLRKEYPLAFHRLVAAVDEARSAGLLGEAFDVEIVVGRGSYVCGEETSLLNSIEHRRPEVRVRPPYPTESGLFGKPTLVSNVETLSNAPWIIQNGGDAYAAMGFSRSRGTKAISLSSLFNRPGVYEIEFGMSLRTIVEELGGGLKTGSLKALIVGGPLAGLIHPSELDVRFGFEEMQAIGASVGHGGIV
ncbi:MAG TPA: hypothetical protein VGE01_12990, partial [Fimbriimonas sp.]